MLYNVCNWKSVVKQPYIELRTAGLSAKILNRNLATTKHKLSARRLITFSSSEHCFCHSHQLLLLNFHRTSYLTSTIMKSLPIWNENNERILFFCSMIPFPGEKGDHLAQLCCTQFLNNCVFTEKLPNFFVRDWAGLLSAVAMINLTFMCHSFVPV